MDDERSKVNLPEGAEYKRILEEMQREKEFSENLINSSFDGILAFDHDCRYTIWNPAMERISGMIAKDVLGKVAFEVFPFLKETGEDHFFWEALAGRTAIGSDRPFVIPQTGQEGFFEARYSPLCSQSGEIGRASCRERV